MNDLREMALRAYEAAECERKERQDAYHAHYRAWEAEVLRNWLEINAPSCVEGLSKHATSISLGEGIWLTVDGPYCEVDFGPCPKCGLPIRSPRVDGLVSLGRAVRGGPAEYHAEWQCAPPMSATEARPLRGDILQALEDMIAAAAELYSFWRSGKP